MKIWHRILEVSHALAATNGEDGSGDVAFAERLMSYQGGHALWMSKTAELEDHQDHGCGREGHDSCLRLDGAQGARGRCACHKGLARMLRKVSQQVGRYPYSRKMQLKTGWIYPGRRNADGRGNLGNVFKHSLCLSLPVEMVQCD